MRWKTLPRGIGTSSIVAVVVVLNLSLLHILLDTEVRRVLYRIWQNWWWLERGHERGYSQIYFFMVRNNPLLAARSDYIVSTYTFCTPFNIK